MQVKMFKRTWGEDPEAATTRELVVERIQVERLFLIAFGLVTATCELAWIALLG